MASKEDPLGANPTAPTQAPKRVSEFDPFAPEVVEDPTEFFAALRREAPVYALPNGAYTLVSRHEDVQAIALDTDTFSSNLVAVLLADAASLGKSPQVVTLPDGGPRPVDVLAIADPPIHSRQRKLVNKAFSPKRIAQMDATIREVAEGLFASLEASPKTSPTASPKTSPEIAPTPDWMTGMAFPLPMIVICRLIGLPLGDRERLQKLSDEAIALLSGINTPKQLAQYAGSAMELVSYLAERFAEARDAARDGRERDDALGGLVQATHEDETGSRLSDDEAASILVQLLTAGQETTGGLIGSAVLILARDQHLQSRLRADPSLIPAFIEEALRLESPFYGHFRKVENDTTVAGVPLAPGTRLMLLWSSANRDERVFENPNSVILDRPNPKAHLGFGRGIHFCLGAQLARVETRIALEVLLERTSQFSVAAEAATLTRAPSLFIRRLTNLPLELRLVQS